MIGVILSSKLIRQAKKGKPGPIVRFYEDIADENNVNICFYSITSMSIKKRTVNGVVYYHTSGKRKNELVQVPQVNLYRGYSYLQKKDSIKNINHFTKKNDVMFFNVMTNAARGKYKIHDYLASADETKALLPATATLSYARLTKMLERYHKLYIKPKHSSKGKNIYVLEKTNRGYRMTHINRAKETITDISEKALKPYFTSRFPKPKRFIVQETIDSKKYKGKKFDFRVFTQKNKRGRWQVTGMYARMADKCLNVTNKDQGGKLKFNLKPLINDATKKEIKQTCKQVAKVMEVKYPQMIDLGLDVAVDKNNNILLIEANFRPYRSKFNSKHYRILFEHAVWFHKRRIAS
ncbi:YheC/YheD family protein [Salipaludibacillus daqingensis]|uniref:YheC/YheD family protein n=1 Tax=Salipaludibacillus daqingensis TaxID=3041001 RepID=UPI0024752512|nr:YheC/YheD family protein [Salipaludibacillus daqingensis]